MATYKELNNEVRNYIAGVVTLSVDNVKTTEGFIVAIMDTIGRAITTDDLVGLLRKQKVTTAKDKIVSMLRTMATAGVIEFCGESRVKLKPIERGTEVSYNQTVINRTLGAQYYNKKPLLIFEALSRNIAYDITKLVKIINTPTWVLNERTLQRYVELMVDKGLVRKTRCHRVPYYTRMLTILELREREKI